MDGPPAVWMPPPVPPIRPCVHCGRGFYTWMRPAVCLDCRCPAAAARPGLGDALAILEALFDGEGAGASRVIT